MARPREFDREKALLSAIRIFSQHGYEGASTDMLLEGMGISRQSLYDTFGTKRDLYLEGVRRYNRDNAERMQRDFASGKTPLDGMRRALLSFIDAGCADADPACLGIGAICEFGRRDMEIVAANEASSAEIVQLVASALQAAKVAHEVRSDLDIRTGTELFFCILSGLKVGARAGMPAARLRKMAALALDAFAAS